MKLSMLVIICGLAVAMISQEQCMAISVFSMIPGADLLRDLTYSTLDTINNSIDQALSSTVTLTDQITRELSPLTNINEVVDTSDPDTGRNVSEIIRSRGFDAEEYDVITKDGYILTIQRIINPLVKAEKRGKLKPVILQHGLMSSSVDWVINSVNVRPTAYPKKNQQEIIMFESDVNASQAQEVTDSQEHPNSLGFYLANKGYDVFLANSRGNIYGTRHVNMSSWNPSFWAFTFDEQIQYDLPDTIAFVMEITGHTKVGYVGHSQGTAMMFGLMSEKPEYADIVEPFIALAPVAYVNHAISPVKYFSVYTPIWQHINMWFATNNAAVRYLGPLVCGPNVIRKDICANIIFLSTGFNEEELDTTRVSAYLSHMPSGTSVKNIAHYGQEVLSGRFAKFDHGILANQIKYGQTKSPDYNLSNIRSKSMALFIADNDWLASPLDVVRLRSSLTVAPYAVVNVTETMPKWNHIDFVYGKHAGKVVNSKILQIFDHFRQKPQDY